MSILGKISSALGGLPTIGGGTAAPAGSTLQQKLAASGITAPPKPSPNSGVQGAAPMSAPAAPVATVNAGATYGPQAIPAQHSLPSIVAPTVSALTASAGKAINPPSTAPASFAPSVTGTLDQTHLTPAGPASLGSQRSKLQQMADQAIAPSDEEIAARDKLIAANAALQRITANATARLADLNYYNPQGVSGRGVADVTSDIDREKTLQSIQAQGAQAAAQGTYDMLRGERRDTLNTDLVSWQKLTAPDVLGTPTVNKATGDVYAYIQSPDGSVTTQVIGNVGADQGFDMHGVVRNSATGQSYAVGTRAGEVVTIPISGTAGLSPSEQMNAMYGGGTAGFGGGTSPIADSLYQSLKTHSINFTDLPAADQKLALQVFAQRGETIPRALTQKQKDAQGDAISALSSLDTIRSLAQQGKLPLARDYVFGSSPLGGFAGSSAYTAAANELTDVKARIRTGAQLNESEVSFYASQRPQWGDDQATINRKLDNLQGFYLGMAGLPVTVTSPDGQSFEFSDLYDPNQRMGLRKAIDSGYKVSY